MRLALLLPALLAGCVMFNKLEVPFVSPSKDFEESVVLEERSAEAKVALIDVDGVITDEEPFSLLHAEDSPVVAFVEKLRKAAEDPSVRAVILRLNTPGGEVTATDVMHHELIAFKTRRKIPVVAAMMGVCASGGYYLASGCDRIVAHPTAITGSIGVIAHHFSIAGLLEKIGVKVQPIQSGKFKDSGSPFRDLTDAEREMLQNLINQAYERFVGVVAEGRKHALTEPQVRALADGRVFTAREAAEAGLVDRIGYLRDALSEAKELAQIKRAVLVMYSRRPDQTRNVYASTSVPGRIGRPELDQIRKLVGLRLSYLWEPRTLDH